MDLLKRSEIIFNNIQEQIEHLFLCIQEASLSENITEIENFNLYILNLEENLSSCRKIFQKIAFQKDNEIPYNSDSSLDYQETNDLVSREQNLAELNQIISTIQEIDNSLNQPNPDRNYLSIKANLKETQKKLSRIEIDSSTAQKKSQTQNMLKNLSQKLDLKITQQQAEMERINRAINENSLFEIEQVLRAVTEIEAASRDDLLAKYHLLKDKLLTESRKLIMIVEREKEVSRRKESVSEFIRAVSETLRVEYEAQERAAEAENSNKKSN